MVVQTPLVEVVVLDIAFSRHASQNDWPKGLISSLVFHSGVEQSFHIAFEPVDDFKDWETQKGLGSFLHPTIPPADF